MPNVVYFTNLDELRVLDVVSWNVLIVGYAQQQEKDREDLSCFQLMQSNNISPKQSSVFAS